MGKMKLAAALLTAAFMVGSFAQNLIENSGFETGISKWGPPKWKRYDERVWLSPAEDSPVCRHEEAP